ncbi:hypothetical protein INR49_006663 [Caranx melampygus]|nr:hypothetical protein INR49_006663 [Caranx melampygus]
MDIIIRQQSGQAQPSLTSAAEEERPFPSPPRTCGADVAVMTRTSGGSSLSPTTLTAALETGVQEAGHQVFLAQVLQRTFDIYLMFVHDLMSSGCERSHPTQSGCSKVWQK